jgi:hypothetical protein
MALYGRWWQLETWLRSLIYVELRARDGVRWGEAFPMAAERRSHEEQAETYMLSPDASIRLGYLDARRLFELLDENWELFADSLIDRQVWAGRVVELLRIRNRIGHCRRPHSDDLGRLEQTLRDLEPGSFRALTSFNRSWSAKPPASDPVAKAWIAGGHPDAVRLLKHADRNYGVRFALEFSRRPWANETLRRKRISGSPGYLWHASWFAADGYFRFRSFWENSYLNPHRDLIIYACANDPVSLHMSFPAVDDPKLVADAIGNCFDAFMLSHRYGPVPERLWNGWQQVNRGLDPRVQVATYWSTIDDTSTPVTLFDA